MKTIEVQATHADDGDSLQAKSIDLPPPPPGHARVLVEAAGVSYGDLLNQRGVIPGGPKPPFVPGFDVTGTVESVGSGVTGPAPGDRVCALIPMGGFAAAANVPAERLVPVPDGLAATDAAAVALNYFIAYQMLHRVVGVRRGHRLVVHGASGGVGLAFLQLIEKIGGVTVWGTASSANLDLVREHGAKAVDYRAEDFAAVVKADGGQVHAVFDPMGGTHFWRSYALLRKGGQLVAYGQNNVLRNGKKNMAVGAAGFLGGIILPKLVPDGRGTVFYNAWSLEKKQPHAYREDLATVLGLAAAGEIAPRSVTTLPLADAERAFRTLKAGTSGKIVLTSAD